MAAVAAQGVWADLAGRIEALGLPKTTRQDGHNFVKGRARTIGESIEAVRNEGDLNRYTATVLLELMLVIKGLSDELGAPPLPGCE